MQYHFYFKKSNNVIPVSYTHLIEAEPEEVFSVPEGSTVSGPTGFGSGC